jgi:protein O-mannosyl-transferase
MSKSNARKPRPTVTKPESPKQKRSSILVPVAICVFLIIATTAVYVQVAGFKFIDLDDGPYVYENHYVQDPITAKSLDWAFTTFHSANWHPITWISHMIDCQLYGLSHPGGHHVTNLLLHILNSLLLFMLLSRMTRSVWRSGFVAALFALHPLHVESVAWVSERKDLLSTFFFVLTILAYVHYTARRNIRRYAMVVGAYALGLMAKPMLVSLPLVLLMLDWWPLQRVDAKGGGLGRLVIEKIPLFALAAGSCVVTYIAQLHSGAAQSLDTYPIGVRLANASVSYSVYICKMFWPRGLAALYPHPGATLPVWQVVASAAAFAAVTFLAIRARRRIPYLFTGWLWYTVMLVPVIGLVQVGGQAFADRYTYIPLIGLFVIIAWGVSDAFSRIAGSARTIILAVLATLVLGSLSACTWTQVGYWKDSDIVGKRALEVSHGHNYIRVFVASSLDKSGHTDKAIELLSQGVTNGPGIGRVHSALGFIYLHKNEVKQAETEFREAIRLQPNLAGAHNNLGVALLRQGHTDEAMGEFKSAASIDLWYAEPHVNMAAVLLARGSTNEALQEFENAVQLDPQRSDARCKIALILSQQGMTAEAVTQLQTAIEMTPDQAEPYYVLGCLLRQQEKMDEALANLQRAAELKPEWGPPHASIAMALFMKGDPAGAWQEVELARKYGSPPDPAFIQALSQKMPEPSP